LLSVSSLSEIKKIPINAIALTTNVANKARPRTAKLSMIPPHRIIEEEHNSF
jgi:hypothetical protein